MPIDSTRAARSLVLATLCFSLMSLFARLVGSRIPVVEIVFVRSLVTLGLTLLLLRRIRFTKWRGKDPKLLVIRGLTGFGALCAFFYSVTHLPLAEATVIHFTHPIFTAILAWLYLGERATARLWGAIALGLTGMLLITRPAALFAGVASTLLRRAPRRLDARRLAAGARRYRGGGAAAARRLIGCRSLSEALRAAGG